MLGSKLSSTLVTPTKVANIFDWRKTFGASVMALDISKSRIGIAIADHPENFSCGSSSSRSNSNNSATPIESIRIERLNHATATAKGARGRGGLGSLSQESISQLESIVRQHQICAFVINWPTTMDGRVGEDCGKVLQVLDSVVDQSNSVFTIMRPFTFWGSGTVTTVGSTQQQCQADVWGRSHVFGRAPQYTPNMRYSSKSILRDTESSSIVAAKVLDDWLKTNWEIRGESNANEEATTSATHSRPALASSLAAATLANSPPIHKKKNMLTMMSKTAKKKNNKKGIVPAATTSTTAATAPSSIMINSIGCNTPRSSALHLMIDDFDSYSLEAALL